MRRRSSRALAIGIGLAVAVAAAGCAGEGSRLDPAMSGGNLQTSATAAPTVSRTTTTTSTQPEAPTETTSPPDGAPIAPEVAPSDTSPEPDGIVWEDLEHLTFEVADEVVRLEGGRATVSYGGSSASIFTLQNRVAQGDLDGDGDEDVVAHIVEQSPGSGVFHLVVPVIDDEGTAVAQSPIAVGDRIVMDAITVRDGLIEVSLFDRTRDEPFTVISRHTMLEIDLSASVPLVRVIDIEPIEDLPLPDPERSEVPIRFEVGAVSAAQSGSIDFRERQTYTVYASQGQPFSARLEAPLGVWLDVRLDDHVVIAAAQRSQLVEATLPATGPWRATLVSSHAGQADYELTVQVLPLADGTPAPTSTAPVASPSVPDTRGDEGAVVYLTFDDGPHPVYTPQVLDVLARHGARATFFVLGSLVEAHPEIIDRIAAEGHTTANHTWNHEALGGLPRAAFDETVSRTQAILADRATPCLRPPYASVDAYTSEWAASHGLSLIMWNVDPGDWRRPPAAEIADHIVQRAKAGAIILLHDGGGNRTRTVQGLDMALERLAGQGLRFEPVCR